MIRNYKSELLSDNWSTLHKHSYEFKQKNGEWVYQEREAYDRGDGAAILLFNKEKGTVILTRQFRLPTFINGNEDGMMVEVCAGMLDNNQPDDCIRRETEEETGYRIQEVTKVYEAYMSPGAVTEIIHCYIGTYRDDQKVSEGGGLATETEDIEVLEMPLAEAMQMVKRGEINDAKTIMLLQYAVIEGLL